MGPQDESTGDSGAKSSSTKVHGSLMHGCMIIDMHRMCTKMAAVSRSISHVTATYTDIVQ